MASEKKSEILKIGVFILIVIGSFLMFPEIGYGCTVKKNMDCTDGQSFGCGFCLEGDNGWICGIKMTPDSYYCQYAPEAIKPGECSNADVWLKQDACPDTDLHNGEECIFADGSREGLSIHCHGKEGNWNGADKACVQCSGKTRATLLADTSKRCWNLTDTTWEEWPVGSTCANDFAGKCDYGCGADLECNHKASGEPCGAGGHCDANCQCIGPCSWQNDACGQSPCAATERHQTCGPAGCSAGVCAPGSTQCVADAACLPCEDTCTCTCPAECPCPLGTGPLGKCPEELKGGLVPCGRGCNDPCTKECECCPCTLCHLFVLFKKIVDFLTINIIFPLAVLMIVIGGVMFLTAAGDPGRIGSAKKILTATVIGILIILIAWLIVDTIIMFITPAGSLFQNWSTIDCPIP